MLVITKKNQKNDSFFKLKKALQNAIIKKRGIRYETIKKFF